MPSIRSVTVTGSGCGVKAGPLRGRCASPDTAPGAGGAAAIGWVHSASMAARRCCGRPHSALSLPDDRRTGNPIRRHQRPAGISPGSGTPLNSLRDSWPGRAATEDGVEDPGVSRARPTGASEACRLHRVPDPADLQDDVPERRRSPPRRRHVFPDAASVKVAYPTTGLVPALRRREMNRDQWVWGPLRGRRPEFSRVIVDHCAAFLAACAFSLRSRSFAALSSSSLIVSLSNLPVNRNGGR